MLYEQEHEKLDIFVYAFFFRNILEIRRDVDKELITYFANYL